MNIVLLLVVKFSWLSVFFFFWVHEALLFPLDVLYSYFISYSLYFGIK